MIQRTQWFYSHDTLLFSIRIITKVKKSGLKILSQNGFDILS